MQIGRERASVQDFDVGAEPRAIQESGTDIVGNGKRRRLGKAALDRLKSMNLLKWWGVEDVQLNRGLSSPNVYSYLFVS
jgi:hypothetical protein